MNVVSKSAYSLLGLSLKLIAHLPLGALYKLSDLLYFLTYHVVRYRVKITRRNLTESFPELTDNEIRVLEKRFYLHFTDYIVETIKLLHISDDEMRRRIKFHNVERVDQSISEGKSIVAYAGHYANWEWLPSITLWSSHPYDKVTFAQIYRPLRNKWFDEFLLNLRVRFHSICIPKDNSLRTLLREKINGHITITGFISDQHPSANDNKHVVRFLNHDTAMITGSEIIAKRMDMDVYYFDIQKVKRGYYECTMQLITDKAAQQLAGAITDAYATMLEGSIRRQPELWLWTHNRWKKKPEAECHEKIELQ